ncbi:MAG: hypothetical protein U9Q79_09715 [Candidatus Hydrogenedentes bacterium]|nr:hypothetical protein [Candidatus Hydrogenedentota bacterium]
MKRFIVFVLIAAVAGACNGTQETSTQPDDNTSGQETILPALTKDNIGDLEQAIMIEAGVAEKSQGANIETSSLVDPTGRMNMFTVDVAPPFPKELWLNIKVRSRRAFRENPGVLRIAIKDGEQVLDTFGTVIGKSATPTVSERSINALAARDSIPDTMLLSINGEALLMPEGTDPDTIDPMTAEVPEERYSLAVPTPPIRINFKGAQAEPTDSPQEAPKESPPEEGGDSAAAKTP